MTGMTSDPTPSLSPLREKGVMEHQQSRGRRERQAGTGSLVWVLSSPQKPTLTLQNSHRTPKPPSVWHPTCLSFHFSPQKTGLERRVRGAG